MLPLQRYRVPSVKKAPAHRGLRAKRWFLPAAVSAALVAAGVIAISRTAGFSNSALAAETTSHSTSEQYAAERRAEVLAPLEIYSGFEARQMTAGPNETLAQLLMRASATRSEAGQALEAIGHQYDRRRLDPGQQVGVFFDRRAGGQARLAGLAFRSEAFASITLNRTADGRFIARTLRMPLKLETARVSSAFGVRADPILGYSRQHLCLI